MLNILLPVTEQPPGRDFCNRNLKRAERVARNLVGVWKREEQTGPAASGYGAKVFSVGGDSPAAIYCLSDCKRQDLGKYSTGVDGTEK